MISNTESKETNKQVSSQNVDTSTENTIGETEFNRENINKLGNLVRITDTDESSGLELLCYTRCGPEDSKILRNCRGVVFKDDTIVMNAFPYTLEYSSFDKDNINKNISPVFNECSFYDAYEGALIRMFHHADKWYISTHRKLNAFRSKWASRESFGTCFKRALEAEIETNEELRCVIPDSDDGLLERFQKTLNPEKQYMFLVRHTEENRIVSFAPEKPKLYHVGTFSDGVLTMDENVKIPYPKKHTFDKLEDLVSYVDSVDIRELQGVICFAPDNTQYKVLNPKYQELFKARGNEPSIKFRYLQVRMNRRHVNMLFELYPKWESTFDEIENNLYDVAKNIYTSYVQRFIKKKFVTVPVEEFIVIKQCHTWHESDRACNRISLEKVIEVMNNQTPTSLNRMLRRLKNERTDKAKNQIDVKQRVRSNTISSNNSSPVIKGMSVKSPLLLSQSNKTIPEFSKI